jgi:long-chain acyl-CoA synthetase
MKLLDDDGHEVTAGQSGEIAIKGPQVMAGYWQRPDETAKVMTPDGYFKTGDVGVVDAARLFQNRRPQKGHDPGEWLQRLPHGTGRRGSADAWCIMECACVGRGRCKIW